jgi:hypothetical protein
MKAPVTSLHVNPSIFGVTASTDYLGNLVIWNFRKSVKEFFYFENLPGPLLTAKWNSDGTLLAVPNGKKEILVRKADTSQLTTSKRE